MFERKRSLLLMASLTCMASRSKFSCDKSLFKQYGSSIFELPGRRGPKPWHCMNLHHMERSLYPSKAVFAHTQTFRSPSHQIIRSLNFPSVGLWSVKPMSPKAALVLSRSRWANVVGRPQMKYHWRASRGAKWVFPLPAVSACSQVPVEALQAPETNKLNITTKHREMEK